MLSQIGYLQGEDFVKCLPPVLLSFVRLPTEQDKDESFTAEPIGPSTVLLNQLQSENLEETLEGLELAEILVAEDSYFDWGEIFPDFCTTLLKLVYCEEK